MAFIYRPKGRKKLYVRFRNAAGKLQTVAGYVDSKATLQLAARLERDAAQQKEGMPVQAHGRGKRTPAEHVDGFLKHLAAKGDGALHITATGKRLRKLLAGTGGRLEPEPVKLWLLEQRTAEAKPMSIGTSNHYLTAAKSFLWWLVDERGWPSNPLRKLTRIKSEAGARIRRSLTGEEFATLLATTEGSPQAIGEMSGPCRAMLYLAAAFTGLRSSELSSLTPAAFHGESLTVIAGYSKRRRQDTVPIPAAIHGRLSAWLKTLPRNERIWPRRRKRAYWAEVLRKDLAAAGIPFKTPAGVVDFHSLRVTYVTMLARAGVPIQVAQRLARHSSPELTSNIYTRLGADDLKAAAGKLTIAPAP